MKKPVKVVLWILGGILALVLLAVLALPLWIGPVVTGVANGVAPGLTGTDFRMESFALNPYTGKIRVGGVRLSNPKGYDEPVAFSVKAVSVDLSFASLLTKRIHVYDITVDEPFVSYVFDDAGSNNFERILANLGALQGEDDAAKKAEDTKTEQKQDGKKIAIDRLCVNGTWVKYRMIKIPIPVPTLTNIGGGDDSEGASPEEVKETVWNAVKDKFSSVGGVLGSAAGNATDALKGLIGGGGDTAADTTKAAAAAVGDGAKKAADAAGDAAKKAADAAGDAANKAAEGLKKLNPFGK